MAPIPPKGSLGTDLSITRVPFGFDVTVEVRAIDLSAAVDDQLRAYFLAWLAIGELLTESGYDLGIDTADLPKPIDDTKGGA